MRRVSLGSQCYSGEEVNIRFAYTCYFNQLTTISCCIQDAAFSDVNGTLYMSDEGFRETLIAMNDPEEDGW